MRIGFVIYGSLDTLSGGYLYDRMLVKSLLDAGDQIEIFSLPWHAYPRLLWQNVSPAITRRLINHRVDVMLQDELNHPSLFALNRRLRREINSPLISIVHHLRSSERHFGLWVPFYRLVERAYLDTVHGFIFNSQSTQATVRHLLGRSVKGCVVTPAGDRLGPGLNGETIRARAKRQEVVNLLFVGNLVPRKGLATLLKALKILGSQAWVLRIVGRMDVDAKYAAGIRHLAMHPALKDRVVFLGNLGDKELENEFRRGQILVVPSEYEGFGIVYLEGMGFGLPAVATTAGGAMEIIQEGKNGRLVAPESPERLAEALGSLVCNRDELLRMSLAARERYEEFPGWEKGMEPAVAYIHSLGGEKDIPTPVHL